MFAELILPDNGKKAFKTAENLENWVKAEIEAWSWLSSAGKVGEGIFSEFSSYLRKLANFLVTQFQDDTELAANILAIARANSRQAIGNSLITTKAISVLASFEMGVTKKGTRAAKMELTRLNTKFQNEISDHIRTVSEFEKGAKRDIEKLKSDLELHAISQSEVDEKISERWDKTRQRFLAKNQSEMAKFVSTTKSEVDLFKEAIKTKIALQAPIDFWSKKRELHRTATFVCGTVFLLCTLVCAGLLVDFVSSYERNFSQFLEFWKGAGLSAFGIFGTMVAIVLIFLRIVYRLFASQLHLWNDSSERVTMIQTYLALSERGHAKEEFLGALLARLFAPASDGVVKDDFGSLGPADFISKQFSKPN